MEERIAVLARAQGRSMGSVRQGLVKRGHLEALEIQLKREKTIARLLGADAGSDEQSEPDGESDSDGE